MFSTSGFRKTAHFRFEVGTGNRKVDDAKAGGEIYTPSKFHSNLPSSFGGQEGSTLKKTGSNVTVANKVQPIPDHYRIK